ncbi:MAG: FAD-dependent oxidoreductase [Thermoplasmata archaeon]
MTRDSRSVSEEPPVVVLGAGYAGLRTAQEFHRRTRGRTAIRFQPGAVTGIDLDHHRVVLDGDSLPYAQLAIALGSVAAYYQIPGAAEHTHSVYRLTGAQRLGAELQAIARRSVSLPGERRPRVVVVGGGTTGTELAAEIAGADWGTIAGGIPARPMEVVLVTGALPFLASLPQEWIDRSRRLLEAAGVHILYGTNVARVEPGRPTSTTGRSFPPRRSSGAPASRRRRSSRACPCRTAGGVA